MDLYTGLRRSEILALKWKNIDFKNKKIYITKSINEIRGEGLILKEPKNESSIRPIELDGDTLDVIKKLKKKNFQINQKDNFVFTFPDGKNVRPDYVTQRFKKLLRKIDLGNHRFHDLCHTHATWLLQADVNPRIVQARLGHHDVSITLQIYSHVIPSMQKNAIKKIKRIIKKQ